MPRKKSPPSYRLHKARNCAVVTINGRNHYLGPYRSPESFERYSRLITEWQADACIAVSRNEGGESQVSVPDITINELLLAYWRFAEGLLFQRW